MLHKKEIAFRYDSSAEVYDTRYNDIQVHKYQEILSRVNIRQEDHLLDVGCGTGNFLGWNFSKENHSCFGVDISFEMIKKAHEKYPDIHFIVADADNLPFRDDCFDNIFSVTHIQNMPEPFITINEMARVAKDNSKLAISVLRKKWTIEKLSTLIEESPYKKLDEWTAKIEDVGILCEKQVD
ncbi:MAG: methyltransferase domain-containing protein [Asgard group archaeon]|nr:methyltransferase domain-containing protein [Asgard group archaeon]